MTKTRLVSVCFLICNAFLPLQGFTSSYKKGGYSFSVRKNARSPTLLKSSTTEPQTQEVGYVVGDTKGAALMIKDIAVSRGGNQLLGDIDWSVQRYERWGIVGPNGAGKSTLLGAIIGTVRTDDGVALVAPKIRVGYLKQTAVSGSTKTVSEEARSEMFEINEAFARYAALAKKIEEGDTSEKTLNALAEAQDDLEAVGGYTQDSEVESVLKGLGFQSGDMQRLCSEFSGGWQMRIALARLLLSKPELLLLDEPSNHLDSAARTFLGNYLSSYDGSMILVSHDVGLLEQSVNSIAEISGGTLLTYVSCSYEQYLNEKEFRAKSAQAEYERNLEEAARLQAFVDKFGASATKASAAQSRVKMIQKMKEEGKLTPPPVAVVAKTSKPVLMLPDPPKALGDELVTIQSASIGHDPAMPPILTNVDVNIQRGMKIILRGPNGAGKSTLMAALRGKLELLTGEKFLNEKLRMGVFTQDLAQELDTKARAVDLATAYAREGKFGDISVSDQDARGVMGMLGLGGDKPLRLVGDLSGGEKARVALSMFALKASNLLLLDEPSNHLDVECIDALGVALSNWGQKEGAVVVISHDREFCEKIGFTHVGTVENGCVVVEERPLRDSDWARYDLQTQSVSSNNDGEESIDDKGVKMDNVSKPQPVEDPQEAKRLRKLAYNAPKRIKKIEDLVEKCEAAVEKIDQDMVENGSNLDRLKELLQEKEVEEEKLNSYMEEWEELETILETYG